MRSVHKIKGNVPVGDFKHFAEAVRAGDALAEPFQVFSGGCLIYDSRPCCRCACMSIWWARKCRSTARCLPWRRRP